jgi:hypothetical protein
MAADPTRATRARIENAAASGAPPRVAARTETPETSPNTAESTALTPNKERPRNRRVSPDANALTRALRKQQPKLEACFKEHSLSLDGQPTTQLLFDLAEDGKLTRVELSPRMLSGTSLGQCLLRVARSTAFPPQPRAVSFAIPLTASKSGGG